MEKTWEPGPYLPLKALSFYAGLSVRTLRSRLKDPVRPLPHYVVGGKILVRQSDFDTWVSVYRRQESIDIDRMAEDAIAGVFGRVDAR